MSEAANPAIIKEVNGAATERAARVLGPVRQRKGGSRGCAMDGIPLGFFLQAEDGRRDLTVTGVQTCALPILDIQACTPGKHNVHGPPPSRWGLAGYPEQERLPCVLDFPEEAGNSSWCRQVSRSSSVAGSGHQSEHDLTTSPLAGIVTRCRGME